MKAVPLLSMDGICVSKNLATQKTGDQCFRDSNN